MSRLKTTYEKEIVSKLMSKLSLKNKHDVPKLIKNHQSQSTQKITDSTDKSQKSTAARISNKIARNSAHAPPECEMSGKISYKIQPNPGGIAQSFILAEEHVPDRHCIKWEGNLRHLQF